MNKNITNPKADWIINAPSPKARRLSVEELNFLASYRVSTIPRGAIAKANPKFLK